MRLYTLPAHFIFRAWASEELEVDSAGRVSQAGRQLQLIGGGPGATLPEVTNVDFQDFDLQAMEIGGGYVTWTPPSQPEQIEMNGYEVFLADSSNSVDSRLHLGTTALGTHEVEVPLNTSLANRSHVFVHTRSVRGMNPDGVGFEVCDVTFLDTLYLVNDAPTPVSWAVVHLAFYHSLSCTGPALRWVEAGASGSSSNKTVASNALDGNRSTSWESQCSGCETGAASIGAIGFCRPEEVRCVRIRQCKGTYGAGLASSHAGCPEGAGRAHRISLLVRGVHAYTWKNLLINDNQEKLREEYLVVAGRRRRAFVMHMSEAEPDIERQTNPAFSR